MARAVYDPKVIEPKWQRYWLENKTFKCDIDSSKEKFYCLDMFPYPSGAGLHVGHPEGYTATDIICRYKRNRDFNVLHPMGWDAFGLPAEQYAIQTGTHPRITTEDNIKNFTRQIQALGFSYDWDREINTTDPDYFRWTQTIFVKLYNHYFDEETQKAKPISELPIPDDIKNDSVKVNQYQSKFRLAYIDEVPVWWCQELGTVLANEEVIDGKSERGDHPCEKRPLRQWMLRITAYADRLIDDLESLDWTESIKTMQKNWIGKSKGANVFFQLDGFDEKLEVFTTRPDTLFGATYMVVAPEHPILEKIVTDGQKAKIEVYQTQAAGKSELARTDLAKEKTGVFTGTYAINPLNGEKIPVWAADYVMMGYGTGAIMAVPAHDGRDFEFAQAMNLPITCIIEPKLVDGHQDYITGDWQGKVKEKRKAEFLEKLNAGELCWTGPGALINSSNTTLSLDGLDVAKAKAKTIEWLEEQGLGNAKITYKLRDWLFSRQRFWGEPIPVVHLEDGRTIALEESELPLNSPDMEDFKPTGTFEPPLSKATDWVEVEIDGVKGKRECNTMPQWAGSCWYYLRYIDAQNNDEMWSQEAEKYWMNVDLYVGGAEHAVLHLLYARFWHKFLYDIGAVSTVEPFQKLVNQGLILGSDGEKMSKSRGNVVNPDDIIDKYGADSMRLYEMFMGPLERAKPWQTEGLEGQYRFLNRVWRNIIGDAESDVTLVDEEAPKELIKIMHQTIHKVGSDIDNLRFNTAISQLMVFNNEISRYDKRYRSVSEIMIQLLAPFAPHIGEEMWNKLGKDNLAYTPWPEYDASLAAESEATIVLQTNGKVRVKLQVPKNTPREELEGLARGNEKFAGYIEGKEVVKVIAVPDKLVNFVIKG